KLAPDADPVDVANGFRNYLEAIEKDHATEVSRLEGLAKERSAGITGMEAEEVGKNLRTELSEAQKRQYDHFDRAFKAIDPEGKRKVRTNRVTDRAAEILNKPNRDLDTKSALAEEALDKAQKLQGVVSFDRLRALDKTLTKLMSTAKRQADPGYE